MDDHTKTLAWIGLLINMFFLPGTGTILVGKYVIGIIQMILYLASLVMDIIYFGDLKVMMIILIPALLVWVWAMITSLMVIKKLKSPARQ